MTNETKTVKTTQEDTISLTNFCNDEKDMIIIGAMQSDPQKSHRELSEMLGIPRRTVSNRIKAVKSRAVKRGYSPDHDMTHHHPDGIKHKGTSSLYDKNGNLVLQWVKTSADAERQAEMIEEYARGFLTESEPVPYKRFKKPKGEAAPDFDRIPFFMIGDGHVGMMSECSQTGHSFDLETAETELVYALKKQIDRAPYTDRCTIVDVGDFSHAENMEGVTQHSGHALDMAGTFGAIIRRCATIMRQVIDYAATKYKHVDIIVNQGNHSRTNDLWMCVFLSHVYEKNTRIKVLNNENVFIPYRFGKNFIMFHHGDRCRGNRLIDVMKTDYPQDWGEARFRAIWLGHVHHRSVAKEHAGVTIESFNQLAPSDAYAHDGGWRSKSCLTCVVLHRHYGECERFTITADEVKDAIDNLPAGTTADYRRTVHTV